MDLVAPLSTCYFAISMPKFDFVLAQHPLFPRYVMLHISAKYATLSKLHSIKYIFLFSEVCSPKRVNLADNSAENILCCEILHYLEFIYWTENQDGDDNVRCVSNDDGANSSAIITRRREWINQWAREMWERSASGAERGGEDQPLGQGDVDKMEDNG